MPQKKGFFPRQLHNCQTNTLTYNFHNFRFRFFGCWMPMPRILSGQDKSQASGCQDDKHAPIDAIIVCPWIELNQLECDIFALTLAKSAKDIILCFLRKWMPLLCLAWHRNQAIRKYRFPNKQMIVSFVWKGLSKKKKKERGLWSVLMCVWDVGG